MMNTMAVRIVVFVGVVLSLCTVQVAHSKSSKLSEVAIKGVLETTVEQVVRPRLLNFVKQTTNLNSSLKSLCATPSAAELATVKKDFTKAAIAWGSIEHFRTGLVLEKNRLERVLFYPDRKSTGLKQVQRRLARQDETLTDLEALQDKSVAVQGFGALEFLLFGTDAMHLETSVGNYRCRFAQTVSANLDMIAEQLNNYWMVGSEFSKNWVEAGNSNSAFANEEEAINELLGILVHGLGAVRDIRIGSFLKKEARYDRPKSALFWRSKNTIAVLRANVEMLESLMESGGLYSLVGQDDNGTVNSLRFEFGQIKSALASIESPIAVSLKSESQRKNILYLKSSLGYLIERVDGEFALMLGLSSGFSFSDGD